MEEALQHLLSNLVGVAARVLPRSDDALDGELDNRLGDLTSGLVEENGEVVLRVSA